MLLHAIHVALIVLTLGGWLVDPRLIILQVLVPIAWILCDNHCILTQMEHRYSGWVLIPPASGYVPRRSRYIPYADLAVACVCRNSA